MIKFLGDISHIKKVKMVDSKIRLLSLKVKKLICNNSYCHCKEK